MGDVGLLRSPQLVSPPSFADDDEEERQDIDETEDDEVPVRRVETNMVAVGWEATRGRCCCLNASGGVDGLLTTGGKVVGGDPDGDISRQSSNGEGELLRCR